jgi:16S rRNA (guanine1207-N2)-methyltransferase
MKDGTDPQHPDPQRPDPQRLKEDTVLSETLCGHTLHFHTTWGLFSPKQIDDGSHLLLSQVSPPLAGEMLDMGCGYGTLGLGLARQAPQAQVELVDKDFVAVDYAAANAQRNGLQNCRAYLSNGFSHVEGRCFDLIVSNLPAKVGRELLHIIILDAYDHLKPGGRLCVVTISGLRQFIRRGFEEVFGNYDKLKQGRTHTVAQAVRQP